MNMFVLGWGAFFTLAASAIIAHISMATPLGPWIAPTIVLVSGIIIRIFRKKAAQTVVTQELALIQTVGSVGGIVAMGIGFTLPMLHFLQPDLFLAWIKDPLFFCTVLALVCLTAGGIGICLARFFAHKLLVEEKLPFPVSNLIYKTITSQSQSNEAKKLGMGFFASAGLTLLRDGIAGFSGVLPRGLYFFNKGPLRELGFTFEPILWSMGFIAGMSIVLPLFVGLVARYVLVLPLNFHADYLSFMFFKPFPLDEFVQAFCSGLVLVDLVFSFSNVPFMVWGYIKKALFMMKATNHSSHQHEQFEASPDSEHDFKGKIASLWHRLCVATTSFLTKYSEEDGPSSHRLLLFLEPLLVVLGSGLVLSYFGFSFMSQFLVLILTTIFAYQISYFSGKVGLVPFGRFATFVMVPVMLCFKLDYVQLTIVSVFANVCYGLATDLLCDYKVGMLCGMSFDRVYHHQWFGLVVTSLGIGCFFLLLFTHFQLGSAELFAHRAKARALLIQSVSLAWQPVVLGFLFGLCLRRFKLNPMMVFGGILMPPTITLGLMVGSFISWMDRKAEAHESFWSGVFAGEPAVIIASLVCRFF